MNTFLTKFNMFERKLDEEENADKAETRKRKAISEETLKLKKKFFDQLHEAIRELEGSSIRILFNKIDTDNSGDIDADEFKMMFRKMNIRFNEHDIYEIFQSMDADDSNRIEFAEFQADFNNVISKPFYELWREEETNR